MRYVERRLAEIGKDQKENKPSTLPVFKARSREYWRGYMKQRRSTQEGRFRVAASNLKQTHGMTIDQYKSLFASQRGRCAICFREIAMSYNGLGRAVATFRAHIDHDHGCCPGRTSCGSCVRGLLCHSCNHGLAGFRDNVEVMQAAIRYLTNG